MKKTFNSAQELATWINKNILCPFKQERLMSQGIKNKYSITYSEDDLFIPLDDNIQLPQDTYNGGIAE